MSRPPDTYQKQLKSMNRRRFLLTGIAGTSALFAGCSGDSGGSSPASTSENGTSTESTGSAEIEFSDSNVVYEGDSSESVSYAEFTAENVGNADSGTVEVTVEWLDQEGSFLGEDLVRCWTIGSGEIWIGQVTPRAASPEEIDDFETTTDIQTAPPSTPTGIEVSESSIEIRSESERVIVGTAESTADESIDSVRARGKIYDSEGRIIGSGTQHEYDGIPSDRDWNFELRLRDRAGARAEQATENEVVLDSRT